MQLTVGDRVVLTRPGHRPSAGKVKSVFGSGAQAYVELDSGIFCTFEAIHLMPETAEAKVWPPRGIETK